MTVKSCTVGIGYFPPSDQLPCPTRAEVEGVLRDIPVRIKADVSAGALACRESEGSLDLSPIQFRVYRALLFLRQLQFDEPLPWTTESLWDWLRAAIPKGIVIDDGQRSYAFLHEITLGFGVDYVDWPNADRSIWNIPFDTIVHEARHAEGSRFNHTCRFVGGRPTGDRTIAEMGALGVGYYLMLWISLHSHESPALRLWAGSYAEGVGRGGLFCCECPGAASASTPALIE